MSKERDQDEKSSLLKDVRCSCHNKLAEKTPTAIKIMCRKCKKVNVIMIIEK